MRRFAASVLLAGVHASAAAADAPQAEASPASYETAAACTSARPRPEVLTAALHRHPEGRLDGSRVTWLLPDGRSFSLERDGCDPGATIAVARSPQGIDDDGNVPELLRLLREYVSTAVGDGLGARLRDRRRWFEAPIDNPSTQEIVDPEPDRDFPGGVFLEWRPDRISVMWPDRISDADLRQMRELRDTQHRMLDDDGDTDGSGDGP